MPRVMGPVPGPAYHIESDPKGWPRDDSWQRWDGGRNECLKLAPGGSWFYMHMGEASEEQDRAQGGRRWGTRPGASSLPLSQPPGLWSLRIPNLDLVSQAASSDEHGRVKPGG